MIIKDEVQTEGQVVYLVEEADTRRRAIKLLEAIIGELPRELTLEEKVIFAQYNKDNGSLLENADDLESGKRLF